jgi:hypothetical protein
MNTELGLHYPRKLYTAYEWALEGFISNRCNAGGSILLGRPRGPGISIEQWLSRSRLTAAIVFEDMCKVSAIS